MITKPMKDHFSLCSRWCHMMRRCYDEMNENFQHYGGRGIRVCERWHQPENYIADIKAMGGIPEGFQIDRTDNDGNYSPDNIRIVSRKDNQNNTRRNVFLTIDGQTKTIAQWCEATGQSYGMIHKRIAEQRMTHKQAVETPCFQPNRLEYDGESLTISQWAEKLDIDRNVINLRLSRGCSIEEALSKEDLDNPLAHFIEFQGRTQTLRAWCLELGLRYSTAYNRLMTGKPIEQVLSSNRCRRDDNIYIEFNGQVKTLRAWCEEFGVKFSTAYRRMNDGLPIEQVFSTTPIKPNRKKSAANKQMEA